MLSKSRRSRICSFDKSDVKDCPAFFNESGNKLHGRSSPFYQANPAIWTIVLSNCNGSDELDQRVLDFMSDARDPDYTIGSIQNCNKSIHL